MSGIAQLFSIGSDYRTAPLALRESISISAQSLAPRLRQLKSEGYAREAAIVSTCNRTEIYCLTDRPQDVALWLAGDKSDALFHLRARDAVRRAFCVASGIESQIIGEPEITGQVKYAAQIARNSGASGVFINRLLEKSLAAAKAVRHQTNIGQHSVSYCGLIARAAAGIFDNISDLAVLFVGAGEMTRCGIHLFSGRGVRRIVIANRTLEKSEELARHYNIEAAPFARLPNILSEFDIVITSTASPVPIIGKGAVEQAVIKRRHRPILFADLGMPRDLESEIARIPDAFVYTLEQLGEQADRSQSARMAAAQMADGIITRHVDSFCKWWDKHEKHLTLSRAHNVI